MDPEHHRAHGAVEVRPGVFRHRHPHGHQNRGIHAGLIACQIIPNDGGHLHNHRPAGTGVDLGHDDHILKHSAVRADNPS